MRKGQALISIALISLLLLSGCGGNDRTADADRFPAAATAVPTILPAQTGSGGRTESALSNPADSVLPPEPGMQRSRLTNEWVDEAVAAARPIAVMVPNLKTASQYGLSQASVVYECIVEGSLTRLMGVWEDWHEMDKIGNVRSCRDYFVYWAFEWDAFFVHFGGPYYTDAVLARDDTESINCLSYSGASYRAPSKNSTDNAFTSADLIEKALKHYEYQPNYRDGYTEANHFQFADPNLPNTLAQYPEAINAQKIDMSPAYPLTNCYFTYNRSTGLYERSQHLSGETDGPHLDLAGNQQLTFKNILIQNTYYEQRDLRGYLAFQCHDTSRDGWFFTNGKGIHVTWAKTSDYGATRYYDDSGSEVELNTGKTMICIIEDGDTFIVDKKKI